MEYNQFIEEVLQSVKEKLDMNCHVTIQKVLKNNGLELDGIMIVEEDKSIAPNIYLNDCYQKYLDGVEIEQLTQEIIQVSLENHYDNIHANALDFTEFEVQKNYIVYRIVNYQYNKKLLQTIPYIRFMDLAITFHCLVKRSKDGIGTVRITNELAEQWGISEKQLFIFASKNTPILFPIVIKDMDDVINEIFQREESRDQLENPYLESDDMIKNAFGKENFGIKMLVLTNRIAINGAVVLLYKDILKKIAEECERDLFILPSSIHEVIIVPKEGNMQKKELEAMVAEINRTQVAADEVLSDHVYLYNRKKDSFV